MILGLTRGEAFLVAFVFALVYAGVLLPRIGERLGVFLAERWARPERGDGHPKE